MSSESDIELQSALPKKTTKKTPKSPSDDLLKKNQEPKKITTKDMIIEALNELKTRKGTSLYAIKKYITEKHNVNVDKINYFIKKNIKTGIEDGTIVQTKGIGVTGSFKLAPKKKSDPADKPKKKKTVKKTEKGEVKKTTTKTKKQDETGETMEKSKEKTDKKITKKKVEGKGVKTAKKKVEKKENEEKTAKPKPKMAKEKQTPAKKRAVMMKRKSIGSIIKPPKMKPKARA